MANFVIFRLILLSLLLAFHQVASQKSSCWAQREENFPQAYVIIGDERVVNEFRQLLLVVNETTRKLQLPKIAVEVSNDNIEFDSADAGPDKDSICYSVRHEIRQGFSVKETTLDIKCRLDKTVVSFKKRVVKNVKSSIFVDATGENVFWRNIESPGEVHVTSIERKTSMMLFADTQDWPNDTPFLIDHRKRLIFWVNLGDRSISYSNLVASSGPIATLPTNADATTFNSMTLDFKSGSIYWLVTSSEDTIYRYNYTGQSPATEVVTTFEASSNVKRSSLQFSNSTLSLLAKVGDDYQVILISLPIAAAPKIALTCIGQKPRIIHDFNVFKDKLNRTEPSCKDLNCSDICLDGQKPQCVCPFANTTLTGRENNTCSLISLGFVLQSSTGLRLQINDLLLNRTTITSKLDLEPNVTLFVTSNLTMVCYATFSSSSITSTIVCKNIKTDSEDQRIIAEVRNHQISKIKYQEDSDTFYWISKSLSNWCFGKSAAELKEVPETRCIEESLENAVIDSRNEAVFWQSSSKIKAILFKETPIVTKTVFSTNASVTILLEEAHETLILAEPNGNVTIVAYDDPEHFQTRNVHPNDGIRRSKFKYYCQRLYWIEQSSETGHDILNSFYFINGQIEPVKLIPKVTKDFLIKVNANGVDCGSIEIQPHVQQDTTTTHKPAEELTTFMSAEQGAQTLSTASPIEPIENGSSDPVLMHHVQQLCQRYFETNGNGQRL